MTIAGYLRWIKFFRKSEWKWRLLLNPEITQHKNFYFRFFMIWIWPTENNILYILNKKDLNDIFPHFSITKLKFSFPLLKKAIIRLKRFDCYVSNFSKCWDSPPPPKTSPDDKKFNSGRGESICEAHMV